MSRVSIYCPLGIRVRIETPLPSAATLDLALVTGVTGWSERPHLSGAATVDKLVDHRVDAEVTDGYPCIVAQFHVHPWTRHPVHR
jgi:hypothetical protein